MLHHVELRVTELDAHLDFFEWLMIDMLGYERFQEWESGRSWRGNPGTPYVVLAKAEAERVPDHIAFSVASAEEVNAIWDALESHGGAKLYPDEHPYAGGPDHYAAYFTDPGGIKIEVVWDRTARLA